MSAAPSPFRFITPRRQRPGPAGAQEQSSIAGGRRRFIVPGEPRWQGKGKGERMEEGIGDGDDDDDDDGGSPEAGLPTRRGGIVGPRVFLAGRGIRRGQGEVDEVEVDVDGDDGDDEWEEPGDGHVDGDGVEDDAESPARKRRRIWIHKQGGGVAGRVWRGRPRGKGEDGDGIEDVDEEEDEGEGEERGEGEEGEGNGHAIGGERLDVIDEGGGVEGGGVEGGSGIDEDVMLDFIRRRRPTIEGGSGDESGNEEVVVVAVAVEEDPPSSPLDGIKAKAKPTALDTPQPRLLPSAIPQSLHGSSSISSHRNPPRFRFSSPRPNANPPTGPTHQPPPPPSTPSAKPTKPASSYFRTLLAPRHQQTQPDQSDPPLGLSIPSDWSPSVRRSRRAGGGAGGASSSRLRGGGGVGKYLDGGLAATVLGWTLDTLSTKSRGEIFGYGDASNTSTAEALWRKIRVSRVSGQSDHETADTPPPITSISQNLALGGVLISGLEVSASRTEMRRYLLVTPGGGRGLVGGSALALGMGMDKVKRGGLVRYMQPWWDVEMGDGGQEEGYRVLVTWEVGPGTAAGEPGGGSGNGVSDG